MMSQTTIENPYDRLQYFIKVYKKRLPRISEVSNDIVKFWAYCTVRYERIAKKRKESVEDEGVRKRN